MLDKKIWALALVAASKADPDFFRNLFGGP
jgi:hypothetical protein